MADTLPGEANPIAVVLGLDAQSRPHAATFFGLDEVALAERAATAMGMHFLRIEGDSLHALVAELPKGQVYKSGNALTPLVKQSVYDQLIALGTAAGTLTTPQAKPSDGSATTPARQGGEGAEGPPDGGGEPSPQPHTPSTWADIMVGSLVGVSEGAAQGWWEAIVVELAPADAPEEDLFTLQFKDFPDYDKQVRRRADLALLPPTAWQ
jgi:hypothetical protein